MPALRNSVKGRRLAAAALALCIAGAAGILGPQEGPRTHPSAARQADAGFAALPLAFEANRGQTDRRADFLAHAAGYDLWLARGDAVLRLGGKKASVLRMGLVGADRSAAATGDRRLPGTANYLIGTDRSAWRTGVPTFGRVRYNDVYPGIDLTYYGNGRRLEFDFELAPGADPDAISLAFAGARPLELDRDGNALLRTPAGLLRQLAPRAYQGTRPVEAAYALRGGNRLGFSVRGYDPAKPLVIDPVLSFSTYLGGSGWDAGYGIAVDQAGSSYIAGHTGSTNFPTTAGAFQRDLGGANSRAFVAKLDPSGRSLVYSTYLGGTTGGTVAMGVAVDGAGQAHVTGSIGGLGFPTTPGAFRTELSGGYDAFVTKLTADGSGLVYSTFLGGGFDDFADDIALDASGNAIVTGEVHSAVPDPGFPIRNAFQPAYGGGTQDAFVTKLNATGSDLVYSSYLGGGRDLNANSDWGSGVAVDPAGNAYVTGYTFSPDFPVTSGAFDTSAYSLDGFVTKVAPAGALVYSTLFGGTQRDYGWDVAVDGGGNAYVTGETESPNFPTTAGAFKTTGDFDAYVLKLVASGSALAYSTLLGGSDVDRAYGIALGGSDAYVTGFTKSLDFPSIDAFQPAYGGGLSDAFVTRLNASGSALVFSSYLGGSLTDEGRAIAVDAAGSGYLTGQTSSRNFPLVNPLQGHGGGLEHPDDAFVAKVGSGAPSPPPPPPPPGPPPPPPAPPPVEVSNLTLDPSTVVSGNSSRATVTLTAPAPPEGVVVTLTSSDSSVATVPPSVVVAAGTRTRSFTVRTKRVASTVWVTISASEGGSVRSATLTVRPRR